MLNKIIANKKKEIKKIKAKAPLNTFIHKLRISEKDFKKAISQDKMNLIAEIKKNSPSKNIKRKDSEIKKITKIYSKYADAVSVLTDKTFFDGSLEDLNKLSNLTKLPVLRKDFIIDAYQIYESRFYYADAILLIASVLPIKKINKFIDIAKNYKMDCIVEINNEQELSKALKTNAQIIGINNRNLQTLEIDTNTTLRLIGKIPKDKIIISESGISSEKYLKKIKGSVNAVLIGSLFMNSENIENEIKKINRILIK